MRLQRNTSKYFPKSCSGIRFVFPSMHGVCSHLTLSAILNTSITPLPSAPQNPVATSLFVSLLTNHPPTLHIYNTFLILQHTLPTKISPSRIRAFFLLRHVIPSIKDRSQHPHQTNPKRRRPRIPLHIRSRRSRAVGKTMLKKPQEEKATRQSVSEHRGVRPH